ncbi:MAG: hypothetical protein KC469_13850, partial [Flavobacteriaceae bacterium]|nr:hypothetical protein [Flavobacteriaceae bacterium]
KLSTTIAQLQMQAEEVDDLRLFKIDIITHALDDTASKYLIVPAMRNDFAFIKENILRTL